jgi:hypothetical protein
MPMLSGPVNDPGAQLGNPSDAPQAATSSMIAALISGAAEAAMWRSLSVFDPAVTRRA